MKHMHRESGRNACVVSLAMRNVYTPCADGQASTGFEQLFVRQTAQPSATALFLNSKGAGFLPFPVCRHTWPCCYIGRDVAPPFPIYADEPLHAVGFLLGCGCDLEVCAIGLTSLRCAWSRDVLSISKQSGGCTCRQSSQAASHFAAQCEPDPGACAPPL